MTPRSLLRPSSAAMIAALAMLAPGAGAPGHAAAADKAARSGAAARPPIENADGEPIRFRVDMHMKNEGESYVMRRYVDGSRTRMEMEAEGRKMVLIELGDAKGTSYTLMPAERRAIKATRAGVTAAAARAGVKTEAPDDAAAESGALPTDGSVESLGTETLDGRTVEKYRVTYPEGSGLLWVDPATQLPLRMEAQGAVVEMKDYDFGPQSPELYEVPKKYDVLDLDEMTSKMLEAGGGAGMGALLSGGKAGGMGMPGVGSSMAGGFAGNVGGQMGAQLGAGLGASVGGPVGAMIGQYLGSRIGRSVGNRVGTGAAKAVGVK